MTTYTSVEQYLGALKAALAGAPPGMIADALADCEEHLRGAIAANPDRSEADVFAEMVKSYGSPEEVAAAYRALDVAPTGPFQRVPEPGQPGAANAPRGWTLWNVVSDPRTYGALVYMLLSLVTGVFYFVWATVGTSLSLGLAVLIIGIPFFLIFMGSVRLLAHVEGRIVELLLGVRMPRRLPATASYEHLSWPQATARRIGAAMGDFRTWSSLFYMFLKLPLGILYFVMAVLGLALSGGLVFGGIFSIFDPNAHPMVDGAPAWLESFAHTPLMGVLAALLGVVVFFLALHLARIIGWLHGRIAEHLLVRL